MFKTILGWLIESSFQSELDAFIASKHPKTAADVEYWTNQYFYQRRTA